MNLPDVFVFTKETDAVLRSFVAVLELIRDLSGFHSVKQALRSTHEGTLRRHFAQKT